MRLADSRNPPLHLCATQPTLRNHRAVSHKPRRFVESPPAAGASWVRSFNVEPKSGHRRFPVRAGGGEQKQGRPNHLVSHIKNFPGLVFSRRMLAIFPSLRDLRTAYVEVLAGMSAFDVKNLSEMAKATLAAPPGGPLAVGTSKLPHSPGPYPGSLRDIPNLSRELGISFANLSRLECAAPTGGMDGAAIFYLMTVTDLGIALYQAC